MRYESKKTEKGNVGMSYVSQAGADEQAAEMDAGNNYGCSGCSGFYAGKLVPAQDQIERLDKVRAIILDDEARLAMDHWHESENWPSAATSTRPRRARKKSDGNWDGIY